MEIEVSVMGSVALLELNGNLTAGRSETALLDAALRLLDEGCRRIVVDLGAVERVDSAGLGALVRCFKKAHERGAEVVLLNPSRQLGTLLRLARLTDVFRIFDDRDQALGTDEGD